MSFSPAQIRKFAKSEVNQLSPQISESIEPKSPWKIPIPYASAFLLSIKKLDTSNITYPTPIKSIYI
ncbi:hypothetical protein RhiirA1_482248 [Rhizophagus irregularis]|uniref:Uncharacterized protein n=1 Tax=Rhizophagus irregularis TaxID=588596 RepID=A0A2N0QM33_9GLOM|nr:hypothetical protein RhiirA1_482248 [Rhizophagus irregularis]